MKMRFEYENDYEGQPNTKITVETDAVTLEDILQTFEDFLQAAGFFIPGQLDFIPFETTDSEETPNVN